jgi:hypothetical protein
MARFAARLTILLFALTGSLTLAIRLLAYDAAYIASVRAALDFAAPCPSTACFTTIMPGATTVADAVTILRGDERIENVVVSSYIANADEFIRVEWQWRDLPVYDSGAQIELHRRSPTIEWISLPTTLTYGEFWLAAGQPRAAHVDAILQTLQYDGFYVVSRSACDGFWNVKVELVRAASGMRTTDPRIAASLLRVTCAEIRVD